MKKTVNSCRECPVYSPPSEEPSNQGNNDGKECGYPTSSKPPPWDDDLGSSEGFPPVCPLVEEPLTFSVRGQAKRKNYYGDAEQGIMVGRTSDGSFSLRVGGQKIYGVTPKQMRSIKDLIDSALKEYEGES